MAKLNPSLIRQALALVGGIAVGFFATKHWRSPAAEPAETNPAAATTAAKPKIPARQAPIGDLPHDATEEQKLAKKSEYDAYLERHQYSREALIAISLLSGDLDYLIEASQRYPDDPQVQLLVVGETKFPGDKSEWSRRLKKSQPDNLLASLLLGSHHFKQGDAAQALEALRTGAGQTTYRDFTAQNSLAIEGALIELGYDPLEAKLKSSSQSPIVLTIQIQEAIVALNRLIGSSQEATEQQELTVLGAAIGNQLSQGAANGSSINRMMGLGVERGFLKTLGPDLESEFLPDTPAQALEEIRSEQEQINADTDFVLEHFDRLNKVQKLHFLDRQRTLGEANANAWLRAQFPQ